MKRTPPLGQHFLTRPEIAGWVADAGGVVSGDRVLEVGPGHGLLTRVLLERGATVVAVERDEMLVEELEQTFVDEIARKKLTLLTGDIRTFEPARHGLCTGEYKLVANIPYYLTGELLRTMLSSLCHPSVLAVLIQQEVAERIVAKNRKESVLSLSVKVFGTPEYVKTVRRGSFSPPPSVESAVLVVRNISHKEVSLETQKRFFALVHAGFASKRKRVMKNLVELVSDDTLNACNVNKNDRAENLAVEQWLCLATNS